MGQTTYYGMAFFDFGDQLDSRINANKEIDRFVLIDKQLYGLYKVFGNGVIDGWTVRDAGYREEEGITVSIGSGIGIIRYMAAETSRAGYVYNLSPNNVVDIYATVTGNTTLDRTISFLSSTTPLTGEGYIRLARVSTGANSILFIDNTIRDEIGFDDIIQEAINSHKHRGTPSKIDLETETKNQLPGARLAGLDADSITTGTFDIDRIPILDHNNLDNNGLLTHAALDSFVRTLSKSNKELLGEVASTNLIKTITFLKYLYPSVDEHFVNELVLIPGISPNSYIDFDASTANISLPNQCISGKPAQTGIFTSVYWNTTYSFNTYYNKENTIISSNTVSLERSSESTDYIATFEDINDTGFTTETRVSTSGITAEIVTEDTNRMAEMGGTGAVPTYYYRKNFATARSWDGSYDELVVKVKTSEASHSPVYMYVVNGSNVNSDGEYGSIEEGDITGVKKPSSSWVLLEEDETMSTLTEKVFDISGLGLDQVTQLTIYTQDDFNFRIDDLYVRRTNLLAPTGSIRFRYETQAEVVFHTLFYEATTPDDSELSVRIKTASSTDLLSRAAYTLPLDSGDIFALSGSAIEVEVSFAANSEQTLGPVLSSIELRMLVDADFTGFLVDTASEWNRGTLTNITVEDGAEVGKSDLQIEPVINVGGRYFYKNGFVSEIDAAKAPVLGLNGSKMPVSTYQAKNWSYTSARGFNGVSSVIRKFGKTYMVADTNNDRILEVDSAGNLVRGFASTYITDTNFYPLTSAYNPNTKVLTITFTKPAVINNITKIVLWDGTSEIPLTSSDTISTVKKSDGKVMEIILDDDTSVRLVGVTTGLMVDFLANAFTEEITMSDGMKAKGNAIFSSLHGLTCFVGDMTYINNIRHPIFVDKLEEGNWIVANSSIFYTDTGGSNTSISDLVEFDPTDPTSTDGMLISTDVKFSDFTLGSVYQYNENRFIVACIAESSSSIGGGTVSALSSSEFNTAAVEALSGYRGQVVVIDKTNNKSQILYSSPDNLYPTDISPYSSGSYYLVSESSFADAAGRLIKIDSYGNIIWSYGNGTFNVINDAKVLNDDTIIVSV